MQEGAHLLMAPIVHLSSSDSLPSRCPPYLVLGEGKQHLPVIVRAHLLP